MPLDKEELAVEEYAPSYRTPAELLKTNPTKAYTFEEIKVRTRYPITRLGLLAYVETIEYTPLDWGIGHTTADGKRYYYWMDRKDEDENPIETKGEDEPTVEGGRNPENTPE